MKPRATHTAARRRLIAILAATGGLAIAGGLALIVEPDGRMLRLSSDAAASTPGERYLVPGLFLAIVVGGSQLVAALAVARHDRRGLRASTAAGLILAGWTAILAALLSVTTWLQAVFFVIAMIELMLVAANLPRQPGPRSGRRRSRR